MPRAYAPELRRRVIDLIEGGRSVAEVAAMVEPTKQTIYNWWNRHLVDTGRRAGTPTIENSELLAARRRIAELEKELAATRRANQLLKEVVPPKASSRPSQRWPARATPSNEPAGSPGSLTPATTCGGSERRLNEQSATRGLLDQIIEVHAASRGTYGARRVHAELTLDRGVKVGHNAIEMLMSRAQIYGLPGPKRRKKVPRVVTATATDLVDRDFARVEPDRLWVTDITEHPTREGKLYCCVVLDTFSRRVVGWSIDHRQDSALVTNALGMAITNRNPDADREVVIHSDHGTQFTSWAFTNRARQSGLVPSMGSIGDCYDNAVIESFWGRMQTELLNRKRWNTRVELASAMFEYVEVFHNRQRRHSSIGMLTPIEWVRRCRERSDVASRRRRQGVPTPLLRGGVSLLSLTGRLSRHLGLPR